MKHKSYYILFLLLAGFSCKDDPIGPEMNCHLNDLYFQDDHFLQGAAVFDIRTVPPQEIKNGTLKYKLSSQWAIHHDDVPVPYPYSEYFIDTILFLDQTSVEIHIFESTASKIYSYTRNDCGLELTSPEGDLHLELTNGGDEVIEQRFAIYDHRTKGTNIDTFSFIEYRLGAFSSYVNIIKQFAIDSAGKYDTIAIELIQNKTGE